MRILAIDTSNQTLSLAVCEDDRILGEYTGTVQKNHSVTLMPAISKVMAACQLTPKELDRIVVAQGPGSYTGLRIGVTTAKTLAYSLNIELAGISSLLTLAANCLNTDSLIVPLFDARRNNVYTGAYHYDKANKVWETVIPDQHISIEHWMEELKAFSSVYFVGEDVEKFRNVIEDSLENAEINKYPQWQIPSGAVLAQLGSVAEPVKEVHHFLPDYLKRVEAEENWLKDHSPGDENYVEKI